MSTREQIDKLTKSGKQYMNKCEVQKRDKNLLKKNKIENLELKDTLKNENAKESIKITFDEAEERICELKHRTFEVIQSEN